MRIVVIGAGVGGMSAALRLAHAGHDVTVLEQGDHVGGKLNLWEPHVPEIGRFRFDTGPHVLTMPWAIQGLFEAIGERMEDWLDLVRMDPICRYHFPYDPYFDAPADPEEAAHQIAQRFPGEEAGFRRLLAYAHRVHDVTVEPFLCQDFASAIRGIPTLKQWRQLFQFLALKPWKSLRSRVEDHIRSPALRRIFELYAEYNGSKPEQASGIFAIIAWEQWGDGTWYLRGGLHTYADALAALADRLGVTVRLKTSVQEIVMDGPAGRGRVKGVRLLNGEVVPTDAVVCNADPLTAYESLIPESYRLPPYTQAALKAMEASSSAFVLLLGVRGTPAEDFPQLAHFNSFLDPNSPTVIGLTCQSVTEPEVAPSGYSTLFVMTSVDPLGSEKLAWTEEDVARYRDNLLNSLESTWKMHGLRKRIVCEQIWTPRTFADTYGAWRGSLYGVSSNGLRQAFLRPPIRAKGIAGLYFAGGGTHPGGGLPLVTLSGKIAAEAVLKDHSGGGES